MGHAIAFTAGAGDDPWFASSEESSLYVVNADGTTGERPVATPEEGRFFGVDWTEDEAPFLVTVLRGDSMHYIARVSLDGTVTKEGLGHRDPLYGWHAVEVPEG